MPAGAWRIRNATRSRANAWSLRGLRFCTSVDDYTNFWKSFAGRRAGEAFVGLEFDHPIAIAAIALRPDNVVYGVSGIFVEYSDVGEDAWVTHTVLEGIPLHYGDIGSGGPTYPRPVWYLAPLQRCVPEKKRVDAAVIIEQSL